MRGIENVSLPAADAVVPAQSPLGSAVSQLPDGEPVTPPERIHAVELVATTLWPAHEVMHNLPVQLTSFIGRAAEITQLRAMLAVSRLVTLTGAGGVGKTRLAVEVAASMLTEFPAGVWLVELAPLADARLTALTLARALGLPDVPGRSAMATIISFLRTRRPLIVLDNCEHLLDACAPLAEELLRACPDLVILATSREPLAAAGEVTWLVPSLPVDGAAIDLFADRGRGASPEFRVTPENAGTVADVCRRLDGIPLAIELAAARLRAFSPGEIAAGLHDRFRLLTGGSRTAARRQQTLRASVDWSHALLTEPERILFRTLAVFAGGFDLEGALAVGIAAGFEPDEALGLLALLVDKSLVEADKSDAGTRYRLPETIRQYALEKLAESGAANQVRARHRAYYIAKADQLGQPGRNDRRGLMSQLESDIENLRAAFAWSLELSDVETALQLASSLQTLWLSRLRMLEGVAWFNAALADQTVGEKPIAPAIWVRAVADAAALDVYTGTPVHRKAQADEALSRARQLGDPALLTRALVAAGLVAGWLAADGGSYFVEAIAVARRIGDISSVAQILGLQTFMAGNSGDLVAARLTGEEGTHLAERAGFDHYSRLSRTWHSPALILQGHLHQAVQVLTGLIIEADAERLPMWKVWSLGFLGVALAFMGQPDEARALGRASIALANELGLALAVPGRSALCLAAVAAGDIEGLLRASEEMRQHTRSMPEFGYPWYSQLAEAHLEAGDHTAAREHADQGLAVALRLGLKHQAMEALIARARVAAASGEADRARDDLFQALTVAREIESKIGVIDALECLGGVARDADDQDKVVRLLGAANAVRHETGYRRFRLHQAGYDAAVHELRNAMGAAAFDQAWAEGTVLSQDEAVSYALRGRGERKRPAIGWLSLTPAEREVARLVGDGLANKEIGAKLFVSPRTVQTHLTHIYGKLGITSRVQLAQQAVRNAPQTGDDAVLHGGSGVAPSTLPL